MGGLGGMLLTRGDLSGNDSTKVVGPPGTAEAVRAFRHFYKRPNTCVEVFEVGAEEMPRRTKDGLMVVPVLVGGAFRGGEEKKEVVDVGNECDEEDEGAVGSVKRVKKASSTTTTTLPGRGFLLHHTALMALPATSPPAMEMAVSYLLTVPERRGKFHPGKAIALGVKPGPDFGKLTKGESITTSQGRIVSADECMDKGDPPPIAAIVQCPTMEHFHLLEKDESFKALQSQNRLLCSMHLSPKFVIDDPQYRAWMRLFVGTKHYFVGESFAPNRPALSSSCKLQHRLSYIDSRAFRCLEPSSSLLAEPIDLLGTEIALDVGSRFVLSPPRTVGLHLYNVPVGVNGAQERLVAKSLIPEFVSADDEDSTTIPSFEIQEAQRMERMTTSNTSSLPEVLFLGTGSAIPSKYRNVSSLLLRTSLDRRGSILIDCGEGTFGQLCRSLGSVTQAQEEIKNLSFVWISHMHADHHLGLLTVLQERVSTNVSDEHIPLIVCGPSALLYFLNEYSAQLGGEFGIRFSRSFVFLDCDATLPSKTDFVPPALLRLKENASLTSIHSIHVNHCYKAYALILQSSMGWKFVYSGDTEYCPDLVSAGAGADILVHEATFEDGKEAEAKDKRHSTISQALRVGMEMNAKVVMLTHFSQRYPKIPPMPEKFAKPGTDGKIPTVVFAFDLMRCDMAYAKTLSEKNAAFEKLFAAQEAMERLESSSLGSMSPPSSPKVMS